MIRNIAISTLIAFALALSACGGGGDSPAAAATTTKQFTGIVGGSPGALTLAGNPLTITGPVTINGQSATAADVKPGTVITATGTTTALKAAGTVTLSGVDIDRELRGPVDAIDLGAGTITVLGQAATVDALTEIEQENPDHSFSTITLADIAVGDFVDISGVRDAAGNLTATRIEREQLHSGDAGFNDVEFRGIVAGLDTTAKTFMIGSDTVDYTSATVQGVLANNARVEVHGTRTAGSSTITATRVEVHPEMEGERGHGSELEGMVADLDAGAKTFTLFDLTIDYSSVTPVPTLQNGSRVEVEGTVDQTNAQLIHATAVRVEHEHRGHGNADNEIKGQVTAVDSAAGTLTVGGSDFWTDAQTVIENDDQDTTFSQIAVNDIVEIKADSTRTQGAATYATKIEIKGSAPAGGPTSGPVEAEGDITAFNMDAHTFSVNGQAITTTDSTTYQVNDETVTATQFFASDRTGQRAEVKGTGSASGIVASKVEIRDRP